MVNKIIVSVQQHDYIYRIFDIIFFRISELYTDLPIVIKFG